MTIDIEILALENILKDGIKDMMSHVAGRSRDAKKRVWVSAAKDAIREYQRKVKEEFLPVLVKDFSSEIVVRFSGGKMSEEDKEKVKVFIEMVGKSSIKQLEKELVKSIDDLKVVGGSRELNERVDGVKKAVEEVHKWIFSRISEV